MPELLTETSEPKSERRGVLKEMSWTMHLAMQSGRHKTGFVIAIILCTMGAAYIALGGIIPCVAMGVALFAAVSDFLLPVTYKITSEGASCKSLFFHHIIKWRDVRACYLCQDGVKVSPLGKPSRLNAYRGVFLRFPAGQDGPAGSATNDVLIAIRSIWGGEIRC